MTNRGLFRVLTTFLLMVCIVKTGAAAVSEHDFRYKAAVQGQIKKNNLYGIVLGSDILNKSEHSRSGMRLFDGQMREVPYVVLDNVIPVREGDRTALDIISYEEGNRVNTVLLKQKEPVGPMTRIYLETSDRDFHKAVTVFGSNDQRRWENIGEDGIYDFSSRIDLRKTFVSVKRGSFAYFKLNIREERKAPEKGNLHLSYDGVDFSARTFSDKKLRIGTFLSQDYRETVKSTTYDACVLTPVITHNDKKRVTEIVIETRLPFTSADLVIDNPYYVRSAQVLGSDTGKPDSYVVLGSTSLHNLAVSGQNRVKNRIEVPQTGRYRFHKIVIENQANPPLNIDKVTARWIQKQLFFIGLNDNEEYTLYWDGPVEEPVNYDISALITPDNWFDRKADMRGTTVPAKNETYKRTSGTTLETLVEKHILTGVIVLVIVVIGFFLYRLWRKTD